MDKVLQTFEGLIRRSIAPSVTLFVIFVMGELLAVELTGGSALDRITAWIETLGRAVGEAEGIVGALVILVVLGVGYGLSAVQQILFDNRLKKNFDPTIPFASSSASQGRALRELRGEVLARIDSEPILERLQPIKERTDYLLYEILGGVDPTDTRPFVDVARAIGIVFSSAIVVTFWNLLVFWPSGWGRLGQVGWLLGMVTLIGLLYWLGREATLAQYRNRALRLYVNFLMMPTKHLERRLEHTKESVDSGG